MVTAKFGASILLSERGALWIRTWVRKPSRGAKESRQQNAVTARSKSSCAACRDRQNEDAGFRRPSPETLRRWRKAGPSNLFLPREKLGMREKAMNTPSSLSDLKVKSLFLL